jgi:hypothetical protein
MACFEQMLRLKNMRNRVRKASVKAASVFQNVAKSCETGLSECGPLQRGSLHSDEDFTDLAPFAQNTFQCLEELSDLEPPDEPAESFVVRSTLLASSVLPLGSTT